MTGLNAFNGQRYLNLESFRKSGVGVRTPLWFAATSVKGGDARLYVYSTADSGKAKRIRRSGVVKIAPCDMRGTVTGTWIDAHARIVTGEDFNHGMRLLNQKYWPWKSLLDLISRLRPGAQRVMIELRAD